MHVIEESVHIARTPDEVYDYLSKAENLPEWDTSIVESRQVEEGPVQVGTHWRGTSKILGRRFDWTVEILELDPPGLTRSKAVEGKLSFSVTHRIEALSFSVTQRIEAEDGGCRFIYKVDAKSGLGGLFGRLGDPIVEKAQRRTVRANLDTLAELLAGQHT